MELLDEKGFVFINNGRAYQVRMLDDQPWLCYWHDHQKCFVTLRPLNQAEVWQCSAYKIPEEQAKYYFEIQEPNHD